MLVYKDYIEFNILGEIIKVISTETDYGLSTVIEFRNSYYYYLGNEPANIESAVFAWQDHYNHQLRDSEIVQVLEDNSLSKIQKLGESNGYQERNKDCKEGSKEACEESGCQEDGEEASKESACEEGGKEGCKEVS